MLINSHTENLGKIKKALRSDKSFDLVERDIIINDRNAAMFFIDGFIKDDIAEKILEFFYKNVNDENLQSADYFAKSSVPYVEVETSDDIHINAKLKMHKIANSKCTILAHNF